jgi:hypothetical protein
MTYDELRSRIGDMLAYGYDISIWSADAVKVERVERMLIGGLNRFYHPVPVGGIEKYQWSFLEPTVQITFLEGQSVIDLPDNFSYIIGSIVYPPSTTSPYPKIPIIGAEDVQVELQTGTSEGRPLVAGVRVKDTQGLERVRWELVYAPVADADYQAKVRMAIQPVYPGAVGEVPLGGQPHEQTILEACLAEVEMFEEFGDRRHTERYMESLASSISHDRQINCPNTVGLVGDVPCDLWHHWNWHGRGDNITTYEGVEY